MKNSFIYTVIFTFILCFFFVLILSFVNIATKDRIADNIRFAKNKAILSSLGIEANTLAEVDSAFESVEEKNINGHLYYVSQGSIYASSYTGPGLWGKISGYIAMTQDLSQIVGFAITDQNETPGLGARIGEEWFLEQLKGEKIVNQNITVLGGGTGDQSKDNGEIDGITGATRTSDGIQTILTNSIAQFQKDLGR